MRQRLTVSFVVLSLVLLLGALSVRAYTTQGLLRSHEARELRREAASIAMLIGQRELLGEPVDSAYLSALVAPSQRIELVTSDGATVVAEGADFADGDSEDAMSSDIGAGGGELTLLQSSDVVDDLTGSDRGSLALLILLVAVVAAMVGYAVARLLSAPFRQLALAAGQLGRGRFDLDLPRTRIPEARAIGTALLTSAGQLQERLASEQAFAEHASHVLRTPLTGLRLELEDLAQRDDVPPDAREAAARSVGRIEAIDTVAGDLVALSRRGALVTGAEIPLRDLATQCAQSWANALAEQDRLLTAAVEGNLEMTYTPGPVEHILDLLLTDVLRRGQGAVRMVFEADDAGHLKIALSWTDDEPPGGGGGPRITVTQARAVVTALGGRLTHERPGHVAILLPRR